MVTGLLYLNKSRSSRVRILPFLKTPLRSLTFHIENVDPGKYENDFDTIIYGIALLGEEFMLSFCLLNSFSDWTG